MSTTQYNESFKTKDEEFDFLFDITEEETIEVNIN